METLLSEPGEGWIASARRNLAIVGFCGLLVGEMLVLTYRFDSQRLVDGGRWWSPMVGYARYLPQALMAAAALGIVGRRLFVGGVTSGRTEAEAEVAGDSRSIRPWSPIYLGAHLAAFAGLVALTGAVWEGPLGLSPYAPAWFAAWLATGMGTLALWIAAAFPGDEIPRLARRWSGVLLAALAIGALACGAGRLTGSLWKPLNAATLSLVRGMLAMGFRDVVSNPAGGEVGIGSFVVEVAPECSGYEGIGLIWVFLGAYLWAFRRELKFPQALWLLPAGTLVIWLANALRIAALVAIGAKWSPSIALGGFHSQAGWLAFNGVALGLVALSRWARIFSVAGTSDGVLEDEAATTVNPTAGYLGPLLALVGTIMLTTAASAGTGFDALYPARVLAVFAVLWACRSAYQGLRLAWSWPAAGIGVLVFAIWMAFEPLGPASAGSGVGSDPSGTGRALSGLPTLVAGLWLAARVVGSVVTVPIAEELAFRGYLTRRLIAGDFTAVDPRRFTWLSFVVSSCLFGGLHGRWLAGAIAGGLYALAVYRKGELGEAILAHAVTNALIAGYVLSTGSWSLWS